MTAAALSGIRQPRFCLRDGGLWVGAAAIVFAGHVAVAYAVQNLSFAEAPDGGPPPALAIEMAPLVAAPAVPEEAVTLDAVTPNPPAGGGGADGQRREAGDRSDTGARRGSSRSGHRASGRYRQSGRGQAGGGRAQRAATAGRGGARSRRGDCA
ncbi:hypothetical protein MPLB_670010 [Mesorhizobium sp. ORS 3324]|nr:hypothetical protein MPLB_670010 [Mesorhizobium sp. ORS 3324]